MFLDVNHSKICQFLINLNFIIIIIIIIILIIIIIIIITIIIIKMIMIILLIIIVNKIFYEEAPVKERWFSWGSSKIQI